MSAPTKEVATFKDENQITKIGQGFYNELAAIKITSHEKFQQVFLLTQQSKLFQKAVDEYFEPIRAPQYDALQATYKKIKDAKDYFAKGERIGKEKIRGWHELQARKAAEQQAKLEEKAQAKAEEKGAEFVPPPPVANKAQAQGLVMQENYEIEISDWDLLVATIAKGKLPRNFISVNAGEIKRFANAAKGQVEIPGVRVYRKDIPKVGR